MKDSSNARIWVFRTLLLGFVLVLSAGVAGGCGQGACAQVIPSPEPSQAGPGETFRLHAEGFGGSCYGEPTGRNVRVELRQGSNLWMLDTVNAGPSPDHDLDAELAVPDIAEPGAATLVVHLGSSSPEPLEIPFRVLGEGSTPETAPAREEPSSAAFAWPEGSSPPAGEIPWYELEADGTITIHGDQGLNCGTFVAGLERGVSHGGDPRSARRVKEKCEQLGLASGGDLEAGNSEVVLALDPTPISEPSD